MTRQEKIASYEKQIAQIKERKKKEAQKHRKDERTQRTKRLIDRGAILESLIEGAATLTKDQIHTLLTKTISTDTAQRILSEMREQNATAQAEKESTTSTAANTTANPKPAEPTGQNAAPQGTKPAEQTPQTAAQATPKPNTTPPQHHKPTHKNNGNPAAEHNPQHHNKHGGGTGQSG